MNRRFTPRKGSGWLGIGAGVLALTLAGCDTASLVELEDPEQITGPVARDPGNINELRNGVLFEFARALTGPASNNSSPGIIGLSGLMTDELWYVSTFPTLKEIDARSIDPTNATLLTTYQYVHRARNLADRVIEHYEANDLGNTKDQAMVTNLAGYSIIFLAENFCSGVPLSMTDMTGEPPVYRPGLTTDQLLDSAVVRFDAALARATAANAEEQQHLARIGKARALLAAGDFAGAAAAVATVPDDFVYEVAYSANSSGQGNGIWHHINVEGRSSAATREGINGLNFFERKDTLNSIDPRVAVDSAGTGNGTSLPRYRQDKYEQRGSAVQLASGVEARLIEAEAALDKGNSAAYLTTLNALRAKIGLPALTDPGAPEARVRQFFEERAFWLWLTGHRLGDLRRMVRHYGFDQSEVFPTGQTIFGTPYGNEVNLPIPFQERNNPEYSGQCIDRNA